MHFSSVKLGSRFACDARRVCVSAEQHGMGALTSMGIKGRPRRNSCARRSVGSRKVSTTSLRQGREVGMMMRLLTRACSCAVMPEIGARVVVLEGVWMVEIQHALVLKADLFRAGRFDQRLGFI